MWKKSLNRTVWMLLARKIEINKFNFKINENKHKQNWLSNQTNETNSNNNRENGEHRLAELFTQFIEYTSLCYVICRY